MSTDEGRKRTKKRPAPTAEPEDSTLISKSAKLEQQDGIRRSTRLSGQPAEFPDGLPDTPQSGGGIGVIGGRKWDDVSQFQSLSFKERDKELSKIIDTSSTFRKEKEITKEYDKYLDNARDTVKQINRKVDYQDRDNGTGLHSLHVGNDIFAQWISKNDKTKKGEPKAKAYTYAELAPKLDARLGENDHKSKSYWKDNTESADQRRRKIALGLSELIYDGKATSTHFDGLTPKGLKWAHKFATILLAERAREIKGGNPLLRKALNNLHTNSFADVFVHKSATLAPFAGSGNAKAFRTIVKAKRS